MRQVFDTNTRFTMHRYLYSIPCRAGPYSLEHDAQAHAP